MIDRLRRLQPIRTARELRLRLRLDEAGPLLTFFAIGLFGWAFVALAGEVVEGDTLAFDRAILLALRNPGNLADPIGPGWVEVSARDFTALGGDAVLGFITLAVLAYLMLTRRRRAAALVAVAIGGGMVLSALLKLGFDRPRPELVPHEVVVYTASFPSGHAMLSAATYLTLGALLARVQEGRRVKLFLMSLAVVLTVIIGVSRVYLGVHWPSDVLAGWSGGAAWAAICWYVALLLQREGKVERAGETSSGPDGRALGDDPRGV